MDRFCPFNCKWLNVSEAEQTDVFEKTKQMVPHVCLKYDVRLLHLEAHPYLYKCKECLKENQECGFM